MTFHKYILRLMKLSLCLYRVHVKNSMQRFNLLTVTPFLNRDVKIHYTDLNSFYP